MPKRKKTAVRTRRGAKGAAAMAQNTVTMLKQRWEATLESLADAEAQLAKRVRLLVKQKKLGADASAMIEDVRRRFERERKRAAKELSARLASLQARVQQERKSLSQLIDDAVHGALRTLNIPSRQEIAHLTRKVDQLSHKIDAFQGRAGSRRSA